jgi:hypothetical protein
MATYPHTDPRSTAPSMVTAWASWILFAAFLLFAVSVFEMTLGVVALVRDEVFAVRPSGLVITANYSVWGWTHLLLGVLQAATAVGLLLGATWARITGIALAAISLLINVLFIAAFPWWSSTVVVFQLLTIYAIAVHGREVRNDY